MPHPDEALIHAWLDGELDAAEATRVEALVSRDAEWAAAAAEARGLIAASSRIVGALDHVSANVIPTARPVARVPRWMARVAALAVIVAGTAVVLREGGPVRALPEADLLPTPANAPSVGALSAPVPAPAIPASPAPAEQASSAKAPSASKTAAPTGDALARDASTRDVPTRQAPAPVPPARADSARVASAQQVGALANAIALKPASLVDSSVAAPRSRMSGAEPPRVAQALTASGVAGERVKAVGGISPPPASAAGTARKDQALDRAEARATANASAKESAARIAVNKLCFNVRQDALRVERAWRLDSAQVADSTRLLGLTARGDTLRNATTGLTAVKIRCPEP